MNSIVIDLIQHDGRTEIFKESLLCSKIIQAMLTNNKIILRTDEGNSFEQNGMYSLLDSLCDFWKYDSSKIIIETNNWQECHSVYHVQPSKYSTDFLAFGQPNNYIKWNKEKVFGMFIGLARKERIYSLLRYQRSRYKKLGLTSFNQHFNDISLNGDLAEVSKYADCSIDSIIANLPYSDIDQIRKPPIWLNLNTIGKIWEQAYTKIAIEIVCETTVHSSAFHVTEKTLRPMYYRRPFIVIGSPNYLKNLQALGFKTFDNFIPSDYDNSADLLRVDNVFAVLETIVDQGVDNLLEKCRDDIEHNYNLVLELSRQHRIAKASMPKYYEHD